MAQENRRLPIVSFDADRDLFAETLTEIPGYSGKGGHDYCSTKPLIPEPNEIARTVSEPGTVNFGGGEGGVKSAKL
jgi:hypothetical protein